MCWTGLGIIFSVRLKRGQRDDGIGGGGVCGGKGRDDAWGGGVEEGWVRGVGGCGRQW